MQEAPLSPVWEQGRSAFGDSPKPDDNFGIILVVENRKANCKEILLVNREEKNPENPDSDKLGGQGASENHFLVKLKVDL